MSDATDKQEAFVGAIRALIEIVEAQDEYFVGYTKAVGGLAARLAAALSLSEQARQRLRMAALLHDIGRIGLRSDVVNKEGALSPSEKEHIQSHVVLGERVLRHVLHDEETLSLIRHHHECYNGQGYPDKLSGEAIPLESRILAVADAFVAMTQTRPHRPARSAEKACRDVQEGAGTQFCSRVVDALVKVTAETRQALSGAGEELSVEPATGPEAGDDVQNAPETRGPEPRTIPSHDLERRIRSVVELRVLPDIVADVMAMTSNVEACDFAKLIARIECDHALSTKVLRLANCALYATAEKIESIDRAVIKIGAEGIRQLVLGVVIIDQWRDSQGAGHIHRDTFWQHSMGTALLAGHIATATGRCDRQIAFTAGLLHDLGQLVLQEALGKDYGSILEEARSLKRFLPAVEEKRLGTDHASMMRAVGRAWGLPKNLTEVMAHHHQPWKQIQMVASDVLPLLLCVRIGNSFSHALGLGDAGLGSLEVIPKTLQHFLGLQKEGFEELLRGTAREVSELAQVYGFSSRVADNGLAADRKGPERPGFYVCEDDAELDPVWCYLASQVPPVRLIPGIKEWLDAPESTWCWVRAVNPGFARKILASQQSASASTAQVGRDLLLLLPEAAQGGLERELAQAELPFLIEPWPIASLRGILNRMRAVREATVRAG